MWSGHQSSSKLKQSNKTHKASTKSKRAQKRALGPGKVENCTVSQPEKRSNAQESVSKANRLNRINKDQQLKKQKREAIILQKRLGSHAGPPKVIAVVPLAHTIDVQGLLNAFTQEALSGATSSTAAISASTDSRVQTMNFVRYKSQVTFVQADFEMFSVLDAVKVADVVLFVVDAQQFVNVPLRIGGSSSSAMDSIISEDARSILAALNAQGIPESLCCVQGMDSFQGKALIERRKFVTRVLEAEVLTGASVARVFEYTISSPVTTAMESTSLSRQHQHARSDGIAQLARHISSLTPKEMTWRSIRSYMFATSCEDVSLSSAAIVDSTKGSCNACTVVRIGGYLRGRPLPVNSLMHIVGVGTGRITQVVVGTGHSTRQHGTTGGKATAASATMDIVHHDNNGMLLLRADTEQQESLVLESCNVDADGAIVGEQTWPSEAEMDIATGTSKRSGDNDDDANGTVAMGNRRRVPKNIPMGMSSYQADWYVDDEGHFDEEEDGHGQKVHGADDDGKTESAALECEGNETADADDDGGITDGLADDLMSVGPAKSSSLRMFGTMSAQERIVAEAKCDADFPDEMDTPADIPARERFARYRTLQSFRSSPWHPKENLPQDYAKIYQFQNFSMAQRRILLEGRALDNMQRKAVLEELQHRAKEKKSASAGSSSSSVRGTRSYSNDMETEESTNDCGIGGSRPSSSVLSNPCLVPGTADVVSSGQYIVMDIDFHQPHNGGQASGTDVAVAVTTATTMVASVASRLQQKGFLGIFSLLSHENKLSVVHCQVQRLNEEQNSSHMDATCVGNDNDDDDMAQGQGIGIGGDGSGMVIKSKEELVFQVGFRTFKARPVFSEANLNSDKHKFERFWRTGGFSVATMYAPISFMPTPVLIFKQTRAATTDLRDPSRTGLQLVGTGTVGGVDPDRIILKKVILTGHPIRVRKKFAVVKHLFHDPHDVRWFKPAEMVTKHGLRGNITEPVGTHGLLKALFSAPIKQNDTVMLILYKRVYPKLPGKSFSNVTLDIV